MLTEVLTLFKGRPLTIGAMAENLGIGRDEAEGRIEQLVRMGFLDEVRDDAPVHACKGCGGCGGGCKNNGRSFRLTKKGDRVA